MGASNQSPALVHVIQSAYHYRDADNYPTTEEKILEDEGWFADVASAGVRCDQLNAQHRALYDVAMARAKRERDAKIAFAVTANREAALLRANGLEKKDVIVPDEFVPTPFENWAPGHSHTVYEVIEIRRSDHDGIATAGRVGAAESDTTGGVASGTA